MKTDFCMFFQIWNIEGSEYDGYVISNKVWSNHNLTKLGNGDKDIGTVYNGRGRWNITPVLSIKEVTWNKLLAIDNSMGYKDIERECKYFFSFQKKLTFISIQCPTEWATSRTTQPMRASLQSVK